MSYREQMQRIANEYMDSGQPWPATARQIAAWAVRSGRWKPQPESLIAQCAEELGRAMGEEYVKDPQGRSVRAKHAIRVTKNGQQRWLWDDIRVAKRSHMLIAFRLRRNQIVGDCKQLKCDVDSYNENKCPRDPIQLVFDFRNDLEEAAQAV
ncbi:MAG: hypothetical protein LAO51_05995 [Acidobacteriia bacterium]|nr:hypothetical protein [Terriglobia bacterium]